jgi:ferredoxin-NADP reductase
VESITRESANVMSVHLVSSEPSTQLPPAVPGQYLSLRLQVSGKSVIRTYSISSAMDDAGYRISVKREPHGIASAFIHQELTAGVGLDVAAPRGDFVLRQNSKPVVLISVGIGVSPVLAMLRALCERADERDVWWLYGARSGTEHPFRTEVSELLSALPHARAFVTYSRPETDDQPDCVGHLGYATLQHLEVPTDAEFYLCGPEAFAHDISAAPVAHGTAPERIIPRRSLPPDQSPRAEASSIPGRISPRACPEPDLRSPSLAATSLQRGTLAMTTFSSSPRHARSKPATGAATESVTTARSGC